MNYESEEIKSELVKLWTKLYQYEKHFHIKSIEDISKKYGEEEADRLAEDIYDAEIKNVFFIDQKPKMDCIDIIERKEQYTYEEISHLLQYVIFIVRDMLKEIYPDIINESLIGECMRASAIAIQIFKRYNVDAYELRSENLFNTEINHSFLLVEFPTNDGILPYIVDITFRQFCLLSRCNQNRVFHFEYPIVFPGYYINEKIASNLLKNGYLQLTGSNAKAYIESFRENTNKYSEEKYVKCIQLGKMLR